MEVNMRLSFDVVNDKPVLMHPDFEKHVLMFNGDMAKSRTIDEEFLYKKKVYAHPLDMLINNADACNEHEFVFSVGEFREGGGGWTNTAILVRVDGKKSLINGFGWRTTSSGVIVNPPQWPKNKDGKYIPLITGKLVDLFLNMIEIKVRSIIGEWPGGSHEGKCSECKWHHAIGHDRSDLEATLTHHCALYQFAPFSTSELCEDDYERLGYSHHGSKLAMSGPQATYAWVEQRDHMFSLSDWRKIGSKMGGKWEDRLNSLFEPLYDDVKVIELLHESGRLDSVENLDSAIDDYRRQTILYHQRKFVERHPEFSSLVRQEAVLKEDYNPQVSKEIDEMVPEEVGEKAHKVKDSEFLDKHVYKPCSYGSSGKYNTRGEWHTYRYVNEPAPRTEPLDLLAKITRSKKA